MRIKQVNVNNVVITLYQPSEIEEKLVAGIFLHLTTERMVATIIKTEQTFCTNLKYCIW